MRQPAVIHPTAIVGPDVALGDRTVVGPYAVLLGPCRIGSGCWIGPHVVVGTTAEHMDHMTLTLPGPATEGLSPDELDIALWHSGMGAGVEIGDGTIVREHTTVHQGTRRPTRIGSRAFVMSRSYVAHDCELGDDVKLGPVGSVAGHVWVGDGATIGLSAAVHQHRRIGAGAMVGMNATVVDDVRPFETVVGTPARPTGLNEVGMRRSGHPEDAIAGLRMAYEQGSPTPPTFAEALAAWRPGGVD